MSESVSKDAENRRSFLKKIGGAAASGIVVSTVGAAPVAAKAVSVDGNDGNGHGNGNQRRAVNAKIGRAHV